MEPELRHAFRTLVLAFILCPLLYADGKVAVSAGGGPAFPVRGMRRMFPPGYGGTGALEFPLNDNISVLIHGGYYRWNFESGRINASLAASGSPAGVDVSGPFIVYPALVGGRLTFDGEILRPYFGVTGGACIVHWRIAGSGHPDGGTGAGYFSSTYAEPAISIGAGILIPVSNSLSLDIGGMYAAFANADDRADPTGLLGTSVAGTNTVSFAVVQAGLRVGF